MTNSNTQLKALYIEESLSLKNVKDTMNEFIEKGISIIKPNNADLSDLVKFTQDNLKRDKNIAVAIIPYFHSLDKETLSKIDNAFEKIEVERNNFTKTTNSYELYVQAIKESHKILKSNNAVIAPELAETIRKIRGNSFPIIVYSRVKKIKLKEIKSTAESKHGPDLYILSAETCSGGVYNLLDVFLGITENDKTSFYPLTFNTINEYESGKRKILTTMVERNIQFNDNTFYISALPTKTRNRIKSEIEKDIDFLESVRRQNRYNSTCDICRE